MRLRLLARHYGVLPSALRALACGFVRRQRAAVALDDVLDALALAVTAWHIARGSACALPHPAPRDRRGLRMAIWF